MAVTVPSIHPAPVRCWFRAGSAADGHGTHVLVTDLAGDRHRRGGLIARLAGDERFHLVQQAQYLGHGLIPGSWVIPVRVQRGLQAGGGQQGHPGLLRHHGGPCGLPHPRSTWFISLLARPRPVNGVDDCRHRINPEPPRGCVGQAGLTEVVLAVAIGPAASPLPVVARWPACWP